jgi:hypothetical protein
VPGLFTDRDYCSGKEAAHEAVVNYREWAATKPMGRDRPARRGKTADKNVCKFENFVLLKINVSISRFYK